MAGKRGELAGLRPRHRRAVGARRGGMGAHTIVIDPTNHNRTYTAISAAACFARMTRAKRNG
jgi:hypothetical protein